MERRIVALIATRLKLSVGICRSTPRTTTDVGVHRRGPGYLTVIGRFLCCDREAGQLSCDLKAYGQPHSLPLGFVLLTSRLVSIDTRTQNVFPSGRCFHGEVYSVTVVVIVSFVSHEVDAECEGCH